MFLFLTKICRKQRKCWRGPGIPYGRIHLSKVIKNLGRKNGMKKVMRNGRWTCAFQGCGWLVSALLAMLFLLTMQAKADEPYARSKDYDLQHSKIVLKFDVEQKKVIGGVTHTVTILKDDTSKLAFDCVGLTIQSVTVNRAAAKFKATDAELIVPLASGAKKGDKFEGEIK